MIELNDVNKVYRKGDNAVQVLSHINLRIMSGEFVAIMGPSGSGKTTLMNILGLLDSPTSGNYFFEQQDVSAFAHEKLAKLRNETVGFVFQSFMLMPRMNLIENISLPLIYQGVPTHLMTVKSLEVLEKVGLQNLGSRRPSELSGGQQQRVAIARALVTQPKIILADEPTGALDSKTGQEIFNLLQDLNAKENTTIVVVTHDSNIANQCKRVIRIANGTLN